MPCLPVSGALQPTHFDVTVFAEPSSKSRPENVLVKESMVPFNAPANISTPKMVLRSFAASRKDVPSIAD